jgi:signal transduction histidine kinase
MLKKIKKFKSGEKKSIYTLVVHNSIWLAGIVLILAALFFVIAWILMPEKVEPTGIRKLINQVSRLTDDDYESITVGKSLGKDGYFEITDSRAEVLYTSDPRHRNTYNTDLLQYLPVVDVDVVYYLMPLENGNQDYSLLIRKKDDEATGIAILDDKGKIVYSNLDLKNSQISSDTMNYLYYQADRSNLFIQKYAFKSAGGEKRYLLIHSNSSIKDTVNTQSVIVVITILLYIITLAVLIILTGKRLSALVVAPIRKLSGAIEKTAGGNWISLREGEEPREMLEVIRSFNDMEERLKASEERQEKLLDQRRKMVADISHDLKTPITVISGYINAMRDGLIPEDEKDRYLEIIQHKTELLTNLINNFSDFSRMDHPEFQMRMETGDLCEYIRECMADRYSELEIAGFTIDTDLPDKKIPAEFDRRQLKRVFENILGNTMRYCGPGTIIRVHARTVRKNGKHFLRILIGDNGPGIPQEYRASVFEPFVVGNESRTSGKGTGLGLSIAKQIVVLHGGSISLTDQPGTVFEILLPII